MPTGECDIYLSTNTSLDSPDIYLSTQSARWDGDLAGCVGRSKRVRGEGFRSLG